MLGCSHVISVTRVTFKSQNVNILNCKYSLAWIVTITVNKSARFVMNKTGTDPIVIMLGVELVGSMFHLLLAYSSFSKPILAYSRLFFIFVSTKK